MMHIPLIWYKKLIRLFKRANYKEAHNSSTVLRGKKERNDALAPV